MRHSKVESVPLVINSVEAVITFGGVTWALLVTNRLTSRSGTLLAHSKSALYGMNDPLSDE